MTDINIASPGASKASLKSALIPLTSSEVLLGRVNIDVNTLGDTAVTLGNLGPYTVSRCVQYASTLDLTATSFNATLRTAAAGGGDAINALGQVTASGAGSALLARPTTAMILNQATIYANVDTVADAAGTTQIDIYGIYCPPL